jgi:hypothetical protein
MIMETPTFLPFSPVASVCRARCAMAGAHLHWDSRKPEEEPRDQFPHRYGHDGCV